MRSPRLARSGGPLTQGAWLVALAMGLACASGGAQAQGLDRVERKGPRLTLDDAVRLALARDERARTADAQSELALTRKKRALTLIEPSAQGSASVLFQPESSFLLENMNVIVTPNPQYQVGAQLTQPLYVHELWRRRDAGRFGLEQVTSTGRRTRQQVALDCMVAYYEALKADWRERLAIAAIDRAKAQVDLAAARYRAGAAVKTALLQAQIDQDRYRKQLLDARNAVALARTELSRLTGAQGDVTLAEPEAQVVTVEDPEGAVAAAHAARPDLEAAEKQVQATQADVDATRARLYPNLSGTASYTHLEPATVFNPRTDFWRVMVTLTVPLYQGNDYFDFREKESSVVIAELSRDQLKKQIRSDVTRAWTTHETARHQVEISERQRVAAAENYELVVAQFKGGTANSTDVTVAQATLAEAEVNLALARYDREIAAAQVRFAVGRLLER